VGISVSYLSQIERDVSRLPIGVLKQIADTLGVHMNWFFHQATEGPADERDVIVRATNRRNLTFTGLGITEELLSPNLSGPLEMLISTIHPGADSEFYVHDGAEAGLVMSGTLELWVGERQFRLEQGDSFAFASTEPHRCANLGTEPVKVFWVITPPHY
jgi:quercetin dioxygenase-like cupin family protein